MTKPDADSPTNKPLSDSGKAARTMLAALKGMEDGGCYAACKHYGLGEEHSAACADARAAIAQAEAAGITTGEDDD
jgi:hypothetical protein